jgi:hypothetical protein
MQGVQGKKGRVAGQEERHASMRRIMCAAVDWQKKISEVDAGSAEEERKGGRECKGREEERELCKRREAERKVGRTCKGREEE